MKYQELSFKLPTDYTEEQLLKKIEDKLKTKQFSYQIKKKSLDARKKNHIHWLVSIAVFSHSTKNITSALTPTLKIPYRKNQKKVLIVGSGPAGFFAAYTLQKAGFKTTIIERGSEVAKRTKKIKIFEETGLFDPRNNYAFGEGGAGTFSDGKLTSRNKHISLEKDFIFSTYIQAGAPEEIAYLAHPHLGSDNLKNIVRNLRATYLKIGGTILFETELKNLEIKNEKTYKALTAKNEIEADEFIIATGHSAHDTYRLLIKKGVKFRTKNLAIGCRVEHQQAIINKAQWGQITLPGVKAAEYRLTSKGDGKLPVYTFCMCPGGTIVPAAAYKNTNIVNGMSTYQRAGKFANAACVAGLNLDLLRRAHTSPLQALDWLQTLEEKFYTYSQDFKAPFCTIQNFIKFKEPDKTQESSYPLGLVPAPLWELLPQAVSNALREGIKEFSKKIKGFETGIILGLESKTSSPIQVLREENMLCASFSNLYLVGEGSGYSGGIISSAADGIKAAIKIIEKN